LQKVSSKVISKDGTIIGFDRFGEGPTVILVDGALEHRAFEGMTQLAELLAQDFTVFHHDRRGRGESTDTKPYAVEREIEDIEAVINVGGGSAFVYGISSGAALAMEATIKIDKIKKLAMYEPPYNDEEEARQAARKYNRKLKELLAEGRLDDALGLFMRLTGMSANRLIRCTSIPCGPCGKR
jgi:pimeloyl-ACP methyl ester carboxylesterase